MSGGLRILVVDDQQHFLDLAVRTLDELIPEARVEGACGGHEALLTIGALEPHVLVLDLRMPGLDGFEVCRRVKEAPATKATKIVAMTGFEDGEAEQLAMTCGADAFAIKGPGLTALARQIASVLEEDTASGSPAVTPARTRSKTPRVRPAHSIGNGASRPTRKSKERRS